MRAAFLAAVATAALPAALVAQTAPTPVPWEDTPDVHLNLPAAPAFTAAAPMPMPPSAKQDYAAPAMRPAARPLRPSQTYRPIRDVRYGLYPDRNRDDWRVEEQDHEMSAYVGGGDDRPEADDHTYVERYERGAERAYADNGHYRRLEPRSDEPSPGPPMPHGGYGQQRTMVYHGAAPPIDPRDYPPGTVITETIVTTPAVRTAQYYVEPSAPRYRTKVIKRLRRTKVECNCETPAPIPYGEKG